MPKFEISKDFHFSAAHVLDGLGENHQCARLHGHNYIVRIVLASDTLDKRGFVQDYSDLKPIKDFIDNKLDHRFIAGSDEQIKRYHLPLGEFFFMDCQTSAENIAQYIYDSHKEEFPELHAVWVSETPKTWAIYCGDKNISN